MQWCRIRMQWLCLVRGVVLWDWKRAGRESVWLFTGEREELASARLEVGGWWLVVGDANPKACC
jgi:hypothetical protein